MFSVYVFIMYMKDLWIHWTEYPFRTKYKKNAMQRKKTAYYLYSYTLLD